MAMAKLFRRVQILNDSTAMLKLLELCCKSTEINEHQFTSLDFSVARESQRSQLSLIHILEDHPSLVTFYLKFSAED